MSFEFVGVAFFGFVVQVGQGFVSHQCPLQLVSGSIEVWSVLRQRVLVLLLALPHLPNVTAKPMRGRQAKCPIFKIPCVVVKCPQHLLMNLINLTENRLLVTLMLGNVLMRGGQLAGTEI